MSYEAQEIERLTTRLKEEMALYAETEGKRRAAEARAEKAEAALSESQAREATLHRALPAASQPEAEPVAWLWRSKDGHIRCALPNAPSSVELACAHHDGDEIVPLYAHPTPAPVVPAEGPISTLEMVYRNMPDIPELPEAYQPRNIARSLAALRPAPPVGARVTGWQPIETAPRDGTHVDLWCLNLLHYAKEGFRKTNVSWGTVTDWFGTEREDWRHGRGEDIQPTHWMPLPEPPAALLPAGEGE